MTFGDGMNAAFELGGALLNWQNVVRLRRDKAVRGVYWPAWVVFALWGYWNIYYYYSLGQLLSWLAGMVMVAANTVWVYFAWKYRNQ